MVQAACKHSRSTYGESRHYPTASSKFGLLISKSRRQEINCYCVLCFFLLFFFIFFLFPDELDRTAHFRYLKVYG